MKKRLLALAFLALGLAACGSPSNATIAATEPTQTEATKTPKKAQAVLLEEWRPAYEQANLLDAICFQVWETNVDHKNGVIDLERARVELQAEAQFLAELQQRLSSTAAPSEAIALYLASLEPLASTLIEVVASGDSALTPDAQATIDATCDATQSITDEIDAAVDAAGLTQAYANKLGDGIFDELTELWDEEGPNWSQAPAARATQTPAPGQEALKDAWRPIYNQGAVLLETCLAMYDTHANFGQDEIALERARAELEVEAEFIDYVWRGITSTTPQNETVASHLFEIETQAMALIELLEPEDDEIGTPETLAAIEAACNSLQGQMNAMVANARSAGMSTESFGELEAEPSEMIEDLYNRTMWGR